MSIKQIFCVLFMILAVASSTNAVPYVTLEYNAWAHATTVASIYGGTYTEEPPEWEYYAGSTDQDHSEPFVGPATAAAHSYSSAGVVGFGYLEMVPNPDWPGTGPEFFEDWRDYYQSVQVDSLLSAQIKNGNELAFTSSIVMTEMSDFGFGEHDPQGEIFDGGWTHSAGTIEIGTDIAGGYSEGTPYSFTFSAALTGDITNELWRCSLEVWRNGIGGTLVASLDADDLTSTVDVLAGETLDFTFIHVPEPATLLLLTLGAFTLRKRR